MRTRLLYFREEITMGIMGDINQIGIVTPDIERTMKEGRFKE